MQMDTKDSDFSLKLAILIVSRSFSSTEPKLHPFIYGSPKGTMSRATSKNAPPRLLGSSEADDIASSKFELRNQGAG